MQIWSGLQGSGTRSAASNTPPEAVLRLSPDRVARWSAGSKPRLRPASWTGWNTTPRTHDHCSACSTIAAPSWALTPCRPRPHGAARGRRAPGRLEPLERPAADPAEPGAAQRHQRVVVEGIELEIDFEADPDRLQFLGEPLPLGDSDAV